MYQNNYSIFKFLKKEIIGIFLLLNVTITIAQVSGKAGNIVSGSGLLVSGKGGIWHSVKVMNIKPVGNYLLIENIGSGKHIFEKQL